MGDRPKDLTPAGPDAWGFPELDVASAWELVEGYPSPDEAVCIALPRYADPCIYGTFHAALEFRPDAPITRAEYAAILVRATGASWDGAVTDAAPDGWYRPDWCAERLPWLLPHATTLRRRGCAW